MVATAHAVTHHGATRRILDCDLDVLAVAFSRDGGHVREVWRWGLECFGASLWQLVSSSHHDFDEQATMARTGVS